jgi:hypothetical protein
MKKIYFGLFSIYWLLLLSSCKKELTAKVSGTAALTIVNGVTDNSFLYTNFNGDKSNGTYYQGMVQIAYGNSKFFNSYFGQQKLGLYAPQDTTANSKPVLSLTLDMPVNTIHTLFLTGTTAASDQLFTTDVLPYHAATDSTMGIRFVNLSKDISAVSVNLMGQANGSEVKDLSYKGITPFKNYPAGTAISSYTFEFRDKITGTLIGSCVVDGVNNDGSTATPNIRRYRNYTLAFLGAPGGLAPDRVLIIDENVHQ